MSTQQEITITPRWIRPGRWMRLTGMSRGATYRALWSGDLKAVQIGAAWFIDASEVEDFFARHGQPASA